MAWRILEVEGAEQLEAELAADGVRRRVVDRRERMDEAVLALAPGAVDRQPRRLAGDPAALELRQHRPAGLPDGRVVPVLLPVADRARGLAGCLVDDLEHPPG